MLDWSINDFLHILYFSYSFEHLIRNCKYGLINYSFSHSSVDNGMESEAVKSAANKSEYIRSKLQT